MTSRTVLNKPRLNGELLAHIFGVIGPTIYPTADPLRIEHSFSTTSTELGWAIRLNKQRRSYKMSVTAGDVSMFLKLAEAGVSYIEHSNRQTGRSVDSTFFVDNDKITLARRLVPTNP